MSEEEGKEKMNKMRKRIERDAYSVLLSFKDGASPKQVEQRMDDTLGYDYCSKYHLAGVYDMAQILIEHPDVRQTYEGKFKIIANEDNQDLVDLISKQSDGPRNKGSSKRGRRSSSSAGYHQRSMFGGELSRSPRYSSCRPRSYASFGKAASKKLFQNFGQPSRPFSVLSSSKASTSSAIQSFGTGNHDSTFGKSSGSNANPTNPPVAPSIQRPLMRPSTASSIPIFILRSGSRSPVKKHVQIKTSSSSSHMPTITEFMNNTKRMMVKELPASVHLSEMTELYEREFGAPVDPLLLFSKSWMLMAKTTFKEFLQVIDGEVSLREKWLADQGTTTKSVLELPSRKVEATTVAQLPISQGFRYQDPNSKPKADLASISKSLDGLTLNARKSKKEASKSDMMPFIPKNHREIVTKRFGNAPSSVKADSIVERVQSTSCIFGRQSVPSVLSISSSSTVVPEKLNEEGLKYDSKELLQLKALKKTDVMLVNVYASLKAFPQMIDARAKALMQQNLEVQRNMASRASLNVVAQVQRPSSSINLQRVRVNPNQCVKKVVPVRTLGQALAEVRRQREQVEQEAFNEQPEPSPSPRLGMGSSSHAASNVSDDGWGAQVVQKVEKSPPKPFTVLLPPMSKGAGVKIRPRSRVVLCHSSASSFPPSLNSDFSPNISQA
ncbi:HTH OST-type domain-containing protein [Caenorhabditis elegans]|uniref:HTH OST-type domain-containing protein n=1 Tax=Caenorhabditis elegans TaxID=6239 RepID=P90898_CAEEL|nr:HTH OST-type domain-containing protein [Caenorhabditis elegans]CAB03154.1 HTH OST-type domain-containing protein [Caenorhabditis elegans]|eukprot:NP_001041135.1 Uncharacterized protein CELE_F58G11.3 [Caenorhabditis elegans]